MQKGGNTSNIDLDQGVDIPHGGSLLQDHKNRALIKRHVKLEQFILMINMLNIEKYEYAKARFFYLLVYRFDFKNGRSLCRKKILKNTLSINENQV
jgi:hypothetical protein